MKRRSPHRTTRPGPSILAALALLAAAATSPSLAADTGVVRLHDVAGATGPGITLGDVADLEGPAARALAATVVGRLAEGASHTVLRDADVRDALAEAGVNWATVSLQGFQRCRVERIRNAATGGAEAVEPDPTAVASQLREELSVDDATSLRGLVEAALAEQAGADRAELRIAFDRGDQRLLGASTLEHRYEITPRSSTGLGRVPVRVVRFRDDRPADRFTVAATVERRIEALVARHTIDRGDRIDASDVELKRVYVDQLTGEPLDDAELVEDRVAASRVVAGGLVYAGDVRAPTLVERGELVSVRAIAGRVVVRTVARATEDGVMDQRIRLRHDRTRETFTAVVTGRRACVIRADAVSDEAS